MRVFICGAGASFHAGYPLTRNLGPEIVEWAAKNPQDRLNWIEADEIHSLFPSLEDFEQIISELQNPTPGSEIDQLPPHKRGSILAGLCEALCEYFDVLRLKGAPLYRQFAEQVVAPGDIVISFNYDISLEAELRSAGKWHIGDGYGFLLGDAITPASPTRMLKLHGSTSWIDILFGGRRGVGAVGPDGPLGPRPVVLPQYFEFLQYPSQTKDPRFNGGGASRHGSMVLPARNKDFSARRRFWDSLWLQASDALGQASEIAIIGYSLPLADTRARDLLFQAGNKDASVSICCGGDNPRLGKEFTDARFSSIDLSSLYFHEWLNASRSRMKPHQSKLEA